MGLSGWLFADLVLALFIILVQQQIASTSASVLATPAPLAPTLTATVTPPAATTSTPLPHKTSTAVVIGPVIEQTAVPTPEPSNTPTVSLSQIPIEFTVRTNLNLLLAGDGPAKQREIARIAEEITRIWDDLEYPQNSRAGLVMTFGHFETGPEGNRLASAVNIALQQALPTVFTNSVLRDFHYLDGKGRGMVDVEVYLFVNE